MFRLLFWLLALVLAIIIIVFSVSNRGSIEIDLWLYQTPPVPVFAVVLLAIFVGFIWGGLAAWAGAGRTRARVRDMARRVEAEQREKAILRQRLNKLEAAEKQAAIPPPPSSATKAA